MFNKILITGGCGFIGSHFVDLVLKKNLKIINLDPISRVSNIYYSKKISKNYKFYRVNTKDRLKIKKIIENEKPNLVINFGADTHVDRSINKPIKFIRNNIEGSANLALEFKDYLLRNNIKNYKFIHISTDEVYGSANNKPFLENKPLKPNSPYSSSKASVDLLLRSFHKTYNFKSIILRPSNNFGPRQHHEKLIPLSIKHLNSRKKINVYGNGKNKREWLYVGDCVETIFNFIKSDINDGIYNIGTGNLMSNLDILQKICEIYYNQRFSKKYFINQFINFVDDRPGHDFMYKINIKKVKNLDLLVKTNFNKNLKLTINSFKK